MKRDYFSVAGTVIIVWWLFDIVFKSIKYGFFSYDWLWYCSIMLLPLGIGLLLRSGSILNMIIATAIPTQLSWVVEYISVVFFSTPLTWEDFSPTYLFQPGVPWFEFVNTMRHFVLLPVALYGWLLIMKPNRKAVILTGIATVLLLGASYLATNMDENINCIYAPCFKAVYPYGGILYSILFLLANLLVLCGLSYLLNWLTRRPEPPREAIRTITIALSIFFAILIIKGMFLYAKVQLSAP